MKDAVRPCEIDKWVALVADDDDDTRLLMASSLRRAGFDVREASNGVELLQWFADDARRMLIVSDIGMPEMDGIEAADQVRRASTHTPILLVTAFGDERTLRRARAAGADEILLKPLDLSLLVRLAFALVTERASSSAGS